MEGAARVLLIRQVFAVCAGAWVSAWILTLENLGVIHHTGSLLWLVAALVAVQLVPRRWPRHVATGATMVVGVGLRSLLQASAPMSIPVWWREETHAALSLLVRHAASPSLLDLLFGIIFVVLFVLLLYSSQYLRLWLFYQMLATFALVTIHINTGVNVTLVLATVLGSAVIGMSLLATERWAGVQPSAWVMRQLGAVAVLAGAAVCAALLLPPLTWRWQSLATAVQSWLGVTGAPTPAPLGEARFNRVGFRGGAQALGGSVVQDYLPVLSVIAPHPEYLRGQVLVTYTGHAWTPGRVRWQAVSRSGQVPISSGATFQGLAEQSIQQTVTVLGGGLRSRVVFGAYASTALTGLYHLSVDPLTDTVVSSQWLSVGTTYRVTSEQPIDAYGQLSRETGGFSLPSAATSRLTPYLSLPATFPERDKALAAQITLSGHTEYQKVDLVKHYLAAHERYVTTGIPIPGPTQDYVDQFLFQTHRGYCNEFSSAFAVLLRSIGIPTRWVTGFTSGTLDKAYAGPLHRYVIRDADAHSWVEVYFPRVGWIPFDPTPGFSMSLLAPSSSAVGGTAPAGGDGQPSSPQPSQAHSTQPPPAGAVHPSSTTGRVGRMNGRGGQSDWLAIGVVACLVAFFRLVPRLRRRARSDVARGLARVQERTARPESDRDAVAALLARAVTAARLPRRPATVRHLGPAASAAGLSDADFRRFVVLVERLLYGGHPISPAERTELFALMAQWQQGMG